MKERNERPIRVLHSVGVMNRGGAETLIMNIYRNIDRNKVQFDFLTHHPIKGSYDDEIRRLGGKIYTVPYGVKSLHFGYVNSLRKFFEEHREYNVIHSHMSDASGIIAKVAKESGIKVRIAHSHIENPKHSLIQKIYLQGYAKKLIPDNCSDFFACSQGAGEYLFDNKKINGKFRVINNSIDIEKFLPDTIIRENVRKEFNFGNKLVIGHIGRFQKQKNHTFLIDIFEKLLKVEPNSILVLIGGGALGDEGTKTYIEKKVKYKGMQDKVIFLGVRDDIDRIIKSFDVLVFPSLYEGLPLTLIEAQTAGIGCVISDTISKEIDLGIGNLKFESLNNIQAWITAILQLRNNCVIDKEKCNSAANNNGYNIKETSKWLEEFYIEKIK